MVDKSRNTIKKERTVTRLPLFVAGVGKVKIILSRKKACDRISRSMLDFFQARTLQG